MNEKIYHAGYPCAHGHADARYVKGGACVACVKANNRLQHEAMRGDRLEYMSQRGKAARLKRGRWAAEVLRGARKRAAKLGLEFDIRPEDLELPDVCPALGVPIIYDAPEPRANRPSLDRTDNSIGYVRGNVRVISFRANQIKNDATADELRRVAMYVDDTLKPNKSGAVSAIGEPNGPLWNR